MSISTLINYSSHVLNCDFCSTNSVCKIMSLTSTKNANIQTRKTVSSFKFLSPASYIHTGAKCGCHICSPPVSILPCVAQVSQQDVFMIELTPQDLHLSLTVPKGQIAWKYSIRIKDETWGVWVRMLCSAWNDWRLPVNSYCEHC